MKLLFQIAFKHSYYRDGKLQESQLIPDGTTARVLKRLGVMMRGDNGSYRFLVPEQVDPVSLLEYMVLLMEGEPLRFSLVHDSVQFTYITDLPVDWCGQLLLSTRNIEKSTNGLQLIRPEEIERRDFHNNAIAVVDIFPDDLLLSGGQNVLYLVDFHARKTYWQYILFNRSKVKLNHPVVCDTNGTIFEGPQRVTTENGEEALSFNSGQHRFSIKQMPLQIFNLVDRPSANMTGSGQANEIDIITGLPTPAMNHLLSRSLDNKELMVSEMYVYL